MENQENLTCPICHQPIQDHEPILACPDCHVTYHEKCWQENHGCATAGCPQQHISAPNENPPATCSNCGAVLQDGQDFCPKCGQKIGAAQSRTCSNCGAMLQDDQDFCPKCGQRYVPQNFSNHQSNFASPASSAASNPAAAVAMAPPVQKSKKKFVVIGIISVIMIAAIVTAAILIPTLLNSPKNFKELFNQYRNESWCEIASDGSWMRVDTNPEDYDSDYWFLFSEDMNEALAAIKEINQELGFSSAVYERMNETSALKGWQSEKNGAYSVSWSYHPDQGLEVFYEIN